MDIITLTIAAVVFLFGITVGSFINVCILRIPQKLSVVNVPSHCPKCQKRLGWHELIPILSYIIQGGKCRGCKCKISPQYPIIEGINGILWVIVFYSTGLNITFMLCCLMASALLGLSVIDSRTQEIPLGFNVFIGVLGAIAAALNFGNILAHILGFFAVSLPLYIIYAVSKGRAIGGGDIKLMAAAGLFLGWKNIILAFLLGCILGAIIHLIKMKFFGAKKQLALGPYLSFGIFFAMLFGDKIITWYFSFF